MTGTAEIIHGDARQLPLDDESVDLIVTSPPYFALRSYRDSGEHYDGQIGSEDTPEQFIDALMECMTEWRRVLKPSGSVWVNLGDKYAGSNGQAGGASQLIGATYSPDGTRTKDAKRGGYVPTSDARPKSLMGLPWRFANACIDDGWILRAEVIWSKPNGLPESVTDRVRRSHEQWFHFVREPRYFSAVDEIREEHKYPEDLTRHLRNGTRVDETPGQAWTINSPPNPLGRLPGSVWEIPTEPLIIPEEVREARNLPDHFAAFPQEWPRRIILGWSPSGVCTVCGEGLRPVVDRKPMEWQPSGRQNETQLGPRPTSGTMTSPPETRITSYACSCSTPGPLQPATVLDPFGGTGTVAGVARALGRHGISVDLSKDYCRLAEWRIFESGHFSKSEKRMWEDRQMGLAL